MDTDKKSNFRTLYLICIILIALGACTYLAKEISANKNAWQTKAWNTYYNSIKGWQIKYPPHISTILITLPDPFSNKTETTGFANDNGIIFSVTVFAKDETEEFMIKTPRNTTFEEREYVGNTYAVMYKEIGTEARYVRLIMKDKTPVEIWTNHYLTPHEREFIWASFRLPLESF